MIKTGDKLLCKKSLIDYKERFVEFNEYIHINEYDNEVIHVRTKTRGFYLKTVKKSLKNDHLDYVWDYFYTQEEVRKLKLETI
ncbi:hypothetical protein M0Q50_07435 [bacterium]|jgi:hypothetical protein|nr:hypothetical protein [bacterium]